MDLSCEYEYIDNETNQNVSDDQSESEEKIPVRNKQDGEFVLGNEVDGILKDKKGELLSLLKADQDDLLVLRALKKSNGNNNNNSKSRNQTQAPSKFPTSSNNNLNQNDTEFITVSYNNEHTLLYYSIVFYIIVLYFILLYCIIINILINYIIN